MKSIVKIATIVVAAAREPESSGMLQAKKLLSAAITTENVIDDAEVTVAGDIMDLNEPPMMVVTETKATRERGGPGEDADTLKRLKKALAVAAKDEEAEEGASPDALAEDGTNITQVTISPAGAALEAINSASPEDLDHLIEVTYADTIREALEVFSEEEDVDEAVKNGDIVTASELREINGLTGTPEESDSPNAVQGDMVGEDKNSTALLQMAVAAGQRWAGTLFALNTPIKYCFVDGTADKAITGFIRATRHFERLIPCMKFQQTYYLDECNIQVKSTGSGCNSYVGKQSSGPTVINLEAPGCTSQGVAAHELGHAIGMTHEQSRTDHERYITILWDNIKKSKAHNYVTETGADTSLPYDYESLMHYGDTDFAYDPKYQKTMVATPGHEGAVMGNRMGLTGADAKQVATMYGCGDSVNFKTCTTNPKKSTYGNCLCHKDLADTTKEPAIVKVTDSDGGHRCMAQCGDHPSSYHKGSCGCPQGCTKRVLPSDSSWSACISMVNGAMTGCRPGTPTGGGGGGGGASPPPRRRSTPPRRRWNSGGTSVTKCAWFDTGNCHKDCTCTAWSMKDGGAVKKSNPMTMASGGVCYSCGPKSCGWDKNAASTYSSCECGYGGTKKTQNCVGGVSCYYCSY